MRPTITLDPAVNFGNALTGPAPVDAVAGMVWAGETVATVADEYAISREQVLIACWYVATHGTPRWRGRWASWLGRVEDGLWHGRYDIPDPPARGQA